MDDDFVVKADDITLSEIITAFSVARHNELRQMIDVLMEMNKYKEMGGGNLLGDVVETRKIFNAETHEYVKAMERLMLDNDLLDKEVDTGKRPGILMTNDIADYVETNHHENQDVIDLFNYVLILEKRLKIDRWE